MTQQPTLHLHHLPTREQNLFYTLILIASPLLNLFVNSVVYTDFRLISLRGSHEFGFFNWVFAISGFLLGGLLLLLGVNLAFNLVARHQRHTRRSLLAFGLFASLYLILNLLTISYGIFAFKVQSLFLLFISICVYVSLNINLFFWYWFIDYPSQIRRLRHPESSTEITFPAGPQQQHGWLPNGLDYLYFTILISNTLGPPENYSASGQKAKLVVLLHSVLMLVVLVIFISRAINTLA